MSQAIGPVRIRRGVTLTQLCRCPVLYCRSRAADFLGLRWRAAAFDAPAGGFTGCAQRRRFPGVRSGEFGHLEQHQSLVDKKWWKLNSFISKVMFLSNCWHGTVGERRIEFSDRLRATMVAISPPIAVLLQSFWVRLVVLHQTPFSPFSVEFIENIKVSALL